MGKSQPQKQNSSWGCSSNLNLKNKTAVGAVRQISTSKTKQQLGLFVKSQPQKQNSSWGCSSNLNLKKQNSSWGCSSNLNHKNKTAVGAVRQISTTKTKQ